MSLVEEALRLGEQGYHVLPLLVRSDGRKIPLIKWGSSASPEPDAIREMPWEDATHVAVACEPSGIVVVDIDAYYDEDQEELIEGEDLLKEWEELIDRHMDREPNTGSDPLYDPPWITTNSNGVHIFLKADPNNPINNSVKSISHCMDLRGVGGQFGGIVAVYADMPAPDEFPTVPEWLHTIARANARTHETPQAPPAPPRYGHGEAGTDYGLKALSGELRTIQEAWDNDEGNFNQVLNRSAYSVGQLAGGGELDVGHAHQAVADLLEELSAPADQYKTLDSGFTSGYDHPRSAKQALILETTEEEYQEMTRKWISGRGLDELPPPQWLIPGWLELNSVAQIFGEPGVGKSHIALDIANRVSRGMGWPDADNTPVQPLRVAYIIAEGAAGMSVRKRAWEHTHGRIGDMRFYPEPLQIMVKEGRDAKKWPLAVRFLTEWAPSLIVFDTQARCTAGVEENSPKEMGEVYERIEELQRATGACILLIHHTSKPGQTARGTNTIKAAITTEIMLRKSYGRIRVKCSKQKNAEEPNEIYFKLEPSGDSVIPNLAIEVPGNLNKSVQQSNSKMLIRQYLQDHPDVPQTTTEIQEATGLSRSRLSTNLNEMTENNEIIKSTVYRDSRNRSAYLWNPPMSVSGGE